MCVDYENLGYTTVYCIGYYYYNLGYYYTFLYIFGYVYMFQIVAAPLIVVCS